MRPRLAGTSRCPRVDPWLTEFRGDLPKIDDPTLVIPAPMTGYCP
jgi:hypothetical protein